MSNKAGNILYKNRSLFRQKIEKNKKKYDKKSQRQMIKNLKNGESHSSFLVVYDKIYI